MSILEVLGWAMNIIIALIGSVAMLGLIAVVIMSDDTIAFKRESRLLRWPPILVALWRDVSETLEIIASGHRAREFNEKISRRS